MGDDQGDLSDSGRYVRDAAWIKNAVADGWTTPYRQFCQAPLRPPRVCSLLSWESLVNRTLSYEVLH